MTNRRMCIFLCEKGVSESVFGGAFYPYISWYYHDLQLLTQKQRNSREGHFLF